MPYMGVIINSFQNEVLFIMFSILFSAA